MNTIAALPRFVFVWITVGLIIGIQLSESIQLPGYFLLGSLSVVALALWFLPGRRVVFHKLLLLLLFAAIGSVQSLDTMKLTNKAVNGTMMATVVERSRRSKTWTKTIVQMHSVNGDSKRQRALLYIKDGLNHFEIGDTLLWTGTLAPIQNKGNPYEFDAEQYWSSKRIRQMGFLEVDELLIRRNPRWNLDETLADINHYFGTLLQTALPEAAANLAQALILGDKGQLSPETMEAFGNAGAMHVLAVSGLHVGLILQMLLYIFGRFPRQISKYQALWFSVCILIFYAFLTGLSASVCRAVLMFTLLAYSKVRNHEHDPINILFSSAFLLLLWNPFYIYDIGFQLSYAAMIGIYLLYRPIDTAFYFRHQLVQKAWSGTALGIAATIFTVPLTTYYFHQFPNYFILSNLLILVLAEVILFSGIGYLSLHWLPGIAWCVSMLLTASLLALIHSIFFIDTLPWSVAQGFSWNSTELIGLYVLVLLGSYLLFSSFRKKVVLISMASLVFFSSFSWNRFQQTRQKELLVYNNNQLCITLLVNDVLHCFYERADQKPKLKYLISGYAKAHSAKIHYHHMEQNQEYEISGVTTQFKLQYRQRNWSFVLNDQRYQVRKRLPAADEKVKASLIFMPWVPVSNIETGHALSEDGSMRIKWQ